MMKNNILIFSFFCLFSSNSFGSSVSFFDCQSYIQGEIYSEKYINDFFKKNQNIYSLRECKSERDKKKYYTTNSGLESYNRISYFFAYEIFKNIENGKVIWSSSLYPSVSPRRYSQRKVYMCNELIQKCDNKNVSNFVLIEGVSINFFKAVTQKWLDIISDESVFDNTFPDDLFSSSGSGKVKEILFSKGKKLMPSVIGIKKNRTPIYNMSIQLPEGFEEWSIDFDYDFTLNKFKFIKFSQRK